MYVWTECVWWERAWPASGAAWCHVTHAAVPVLYLSLYVELSPSLSQQSHHIHFAFLSCQVKSSPAILCTETQSAHLVQLYIVTLCVMVWCAAIYSNTVCDVQCVLVVGAVIIPCPVCWAEPETQWVPSPPQHVPQMMPSSLASCHPVWMIERKYNSIR